MYKDSETLRGQLALFEGSGKPIRLAEGEVRALAPGEVLVRNVYTTLCGSDLHTFCGLRQEACPTVLGHEIVGEIVQLDPDHNGLDLLGEKLLPGDRITWTIFASDPQSFNAQRGMPQKGEGLYKYGHVKAEGTELFHGGLADYCILQAHTGIIKLPAGMPDAVAAPLNCSVSTVAGALRLAGEIKGRNVLITGMGHLGITCAAMCREAGASWIGVADISRERLEAAMHFGASEHFDLSGDNSLLQEALRERTGGRGLDIVFDMSGAPDAMEFGLQSLGIGGTAVWVGAVFNTRPIPINPEKMIRNLLTIKGLHNYNFDDFIYAFHFMRGNWERYPFAAIVESEFPLQSVQEAFEYAHARKPLRVGVNFKQKG